MMNFEDAVDQYVTDVNVVQLDNSENLPYVTLVVAKFARNYVKLIKNNYDRKTMKDLNSGSVYAFIVKNPEDKKFNVGDILKPASWKAPARNFIRGSVFDSFTYSPIGAYSA